MINPKHIELLSPSLKAILEAELKAGNKVIETSLGGFTKCSDDHVFVWLKYPFKATKKNDLDGIIYRLIDDRHYWQAEYYDEINHQTLACNF